MASFTHNLNIVARCTQMHRTRELKELGICGGQTPYLLSICRNPGITQEELARRVYVNKSTAARMIGHLERAGYVERRPSPDDKRCVTLYPTEAALAAVPKVRNVIHSWNDYLLEGLDEGERDALIHLMEKISKRAQSYIRREEGWEE